MRSTITNQNDSEIIKCVKADIEVYRVIRDRINDYSDWLSSAGLKVVDTTVDYKDGLIYFSQPFIDLRRSDPDYMTRAILKLEFKEFGLDASPDNFLGEGLLVDLYPFLVNQWEVLELQFDYPYKEIKGRYFNRASVLATYLIRLYKIDSEKSLDLVSEYGDFLSKGITAHEILLRECCRLLKMLSLGIGGELEFSKFYKQTKIGCIFSENDRDRLLQLLAGL